MKKNKRLTIIILILLVIVISLISFVGIYTKNLNTYSNNLKNYDLGMEFEGKRVIKFAVDTSEEQVTYDADGNVIENHTHEEGETEEEAHEGETTEMVKVNKEEVLTKENYQRSKNVLENRILKTGIGQYNFRVDENTGTIWLETEDIDYLEQMLGLLITKGEFELIDSETDEVLIDNSYIKNCEIIQDDMTSRGVYLSIRLNKEGEKKVEELKKMYSELKDDEGNTVTRSLIFKIDDEQLQTDTYSNILGNKELVYPIESVSTTQSMLQTNLIEASNILMILNSGSYPIEYVIESDELLIPNTENIKLIFTIIITVILTITHIIMVIRYKEKGILGVISGIGYIAVLLLIIRYTNTLITYQSIAALIITTILTYVFIILAINKNEDLRKNVKSLISISIPVLIIAIVFSFARQAQVNSFGIALFWGTLISNIYNFLYTKTILEINRK